MEKFDKKKAEEEVIRTMTISKYTSLRYMSTIAFFICLYMIIGSVLVGDEIGEMNVYYEKLGEFLNKDSRVEKAKKSKNIEEFKRIFLGG